MANAYLGEVDLKMGDGSYVIVLDWKAMAAIHTMYGEGVLDDLAKSMADVEKLANILVIALKRHHKDITVEKVLEVSPPLLTVITALDLALTYAVYGAQDPRSVDAKEKSEEVESDVKKKTT